MIKIELADIKDATALSNLFEELVGEKTNLSKMKENLSFIISNKDYYILCAKDENNKLLGSVMGIVCADICGDCQPFMVLENMIVSENARGKGIGRKLVEQLEEYAKQRNCTYIMLVSLIKRKGAHKFYESLGFGLDVVQGFKKYL
jgi:GNAT superfamily N-acetyltransferase